MIISPIQPVPHDRPYFDTPPPLTACPPYRKGSFLLSPADHHQGDKQSYDYSQDSPTGQRPRPARSLPAITRPGLTDVTELALTGEARTVSVISFDAPVGPTRPGLNDVTGPEVELATTLPDSGITYNHLGVI